jgi:hypothetical protein
MSFNFYKRILQLKKWFPPSSSKFFFFLFSHKIQSLIMFNKNIITNKLEGMSKILFTNTL